MQAILYSVDVEQRDHLIEALGIITMNQDGLVGAEKRDSHTQTHVNEPFQPQYSKEKVCARSCRVRYSMACDCCKK